MLLKDFYTIRSTETIDAHHYVVQVLVNEQHDVFKGHFPGNPVMPGVCMIQIIKELTAGLTRQPLFLQSLGNVKFMALINPFVNPLLTLELAITPPDAAIVKVKAAAFFNDTLALKLSAVFVIQGTPTDNK